MACGMTDVLTKPFDRLTLSRKVASEITELQKIEIFWGWKKDLASFQTAKADREK